MTSDERVERVARAVCEHRGLHPDWSKQPRTVQEYYREIARAALAAAGPDVPKEVVEAARYEARIAEGREHSMAGIMARWILSSCGEKP
jgi:hypothetical protein